MVIWDFINNQIGRLKVIKDNPYAIAGGLAIGVLVGFTPLFGVKTLLALGLAWLLRCNMIAAVVAVCLHDLLTPLAPFMLRLEYDIGYWLMSHPHHLPPELDLLQAHLHFADMLKWTTYLDVGLPVLLGSLVISTPLAIVVYILGFVFTKARRKAVGTGPSGPGAEG